MNPIQDHKETNVHTNSCLPHLSQTSVNPASSTAFVQCGMHSERHPFPVKDVILTLMVRLEWAAGLRVLLAMLLIYTNRVYLLLLAGDQA